MTQEPNGDLGEIRLQIVKSMFAEFPDLKIQITKEMIIESLSQTEIPLGKLLDSVARNSRFSYREISQESYRRNRIPQKESMPVWAKFAMASTKQSGERYYVFK